jgi:beta-carotene 15,15'-dioxygenase
MTIGAFVVTLIGLPLDTPVVILMACPIILLFGLPHGTLDIALIGKSKTPLQNVGIVALYLGLAGAMFAVWHIHAGLALLIFFGLSIAHFSEDWAEQLSPFFAHGTAAALILAPVMLHRATLEMLFGALVDAGSAVSVINAAILFAPIALAVAVVGVWSLWLDGHRQIAVSTGLAVAALVFLPPLIGFALFFCLMHSPKQLSTGLERLGWQHDRIWLRVVIPMTVASLAISGAIFYGGTVLSPVLSSVRTVFVTLSVLTLPHMMMPLLMRRIARPYSRKSV